MTHPTRPFELAQVEPFHAISIGKLAYELAEQGRSVIHMEYGQPSTGAPAAALAKAREVLDTEAGGYWENEALKQRIARHYRERYGQHVESDQIILTCGASPALVLALSSLFAPGARVALARPGYVAYRNTLKAMYLEPVEIECGAEARYQLSAAALEALEPAPDGVIIASPANPTGTIIEAADLRAIAEVCARRGIRIVSDEIYHGLTYGPEAHSLLEYAPEAVVINSFSKYYSMTGWRLGWLLVPRDLVAVARARMGNLFLTPPVLAQHAGLVAFDCTEELEGHVEIYARNRQMLLEALPRLGLERIAPPDGAFYIWADISAYTQDSLAFCREMLRETGVATAPGIDFDPVHGAGFMRFSFAVSPAEIVEAIERLVPWFATRRGRTGPS
ncbi:aminotransferase class I/II-fold pyridoxal phosphate-dependent enzyme [Novosphingobium profundi]|uniref:pyridoxal phosphate-dependent aminotransferase n=1 Tax=Novosphingobium profundi TaxID=1774954 RepID=UPI001BDAE3C5|nr:aminotransferase class I/II-fold pyridoxal phosphate-dependent enzyme [Novosphingobium profundi]MBT0670444.1 aminotransferase class I/II-fold pyridoxal phosphate-dependent enzyme [Novosphingobium profundi]